jgi:hypothetical protein
MKIMVGKIHHNDELRTSAQAARVAQVVKGLTKNHIDVTSIVDVWFQPPVPPASNGVMTRFRAGRLDFEQEKFSMFESRRRRGNTKPPGLRKWIRLSRHIVKNFFDTHSSEVIARRIFIEKILTEKHIFLWTGLANSDATGALIFEDDFEIPSAESVTKLVKVLSQYGASADLIDLAGGYSRQALGLPEAPGQDLELELLVANTTCAYFIGKQLAQKLVQLAFENPKAKRLGVDFFIPYANRGETHWRTVLPAELPFVHGSFHGGVPSSIRG